ncbi:MAG: DUF2914 domain-containing protein [Candidatus Latescibacterota bacterium]
MNALLSWCTRFYQRHEKRAAVAFFAGGVGYDFLTLTRIDRLLDSLIILGYLTALGLLIVLLGRLQRGRVPWMRLRRGGHLLPLGIQFLLGSLFSAYTVFYFSSVSLTRTAVFFGLLVGLLLANEVLRERLGNLTLLTAMFFFASFSFFIFFVPVLASTVSTWTFALGTLLALASVAGVLWAIFAGESGAAARQGAVQLRRCAAAAGGLGAILVAFYALNWIPPVPLSLRFGGAYHEVRKEGSVYYLTYARPSPLRCWQKSENPVRWRPGERVYCFASVFAPTRLETRIYHRWQRYDERRDRWVEEGRSGYGVSGGRRGGYRGFTYKQHVSPGEWRVEVETENGRLLGRVGFEIADATGQEREYLIYPHR